MKNEDVYNFLNSLVNNHNPRMFRYLYEKDEIHPEFVSVIAPYKMCADYIQVVNDYLVVISLDEVEYGSEDDWGYATFKSIEDYIENSITKKDTLCTFDIGYDNFEDCFKSAVFSIL